MIGLYLFFKMLFILCAALFYLVVGAALALGWLVYAIVVVAGWLAVAVGAFVAFVVALIKEWRASRTITA